MNIAFTGALLSGGLGGKISAVITVLAILILGLSVLLGKSRGMYKTAIRMITLGLSLWLTSHLSKVMTDAFHNLFIGHSAESIITKVWPDYSVVVDQTTRDIINSFDVQTMERLIAMGTAIVLIPIAFILVFYTVKFFSMFFYMLFNGILRMSRQKSAVSSIMGMILGVIQGAFVIWVLVMPIAGLAGVAKDARPVITSDDKDPSVVAKINNIYTEYVDDIADNAVVKMVGAFGGEDMFRSITTVKVAGETVDMQKEVIVVLNIVADGYPLMDGGFSWAELRDKDKAAMLAILADIGEDEYTSTTVAGVLRGMVIAYDKGYLNLGFEEPFKSFMDEFVHVFSDSSEDNVEEDFRTFLDVYFILNDARVLACFGGATEDVAEQLLAATDENGKKVITSVTDRLAENQRTAHIVTSLTKFSLSLMAQSTGNILGDNTDAIYEDVKVGMHDVLLNVNDPSIPEEEKYDVVKESLNTTLINSGVVTADAPLSDETMNTITDYVLENFAGKEELTDDDINSAILSYYNQYGTPEGVNPDDANPDVIPDGVGDKEEGNNPADPTDPVDPVDPEQGGEGEPTNPGEPADPSDPENDEDDEPDQPPVDEDPLPIAA